MKKILYYFLPLMLVVSACDKQNIDEFEKNPEKAPRILTAQFDTEATKADLGEDGLTPELESTFVLGEGVAPHDCFMVYDGSGHRMLYMVDSKIGGIYTFKPWEYNNGYYPGNSEEGLSTTGPLYAVYWGAVPIYHLMGGATDGSEYNQFMYKMYAPYGSYDNSKYKICLPSTPAVPEYIRLNGALENAMFIGQSSDGEPDHLIFKNACALIKVSVPSELFEDVDSDSDIVFTLFLSTGASIEQDGGTSTWIAGTIDRQADVVWNEGNPSFSNYSPMSFNGNKNGSFATMILSQGDYYIPFFPQTINTNISICFNYRSKEGGFRRYYAIKDLSGGKSMTFERNKIYNFGSLGTEGRWKEVDFFESKVIGL